MAVARNLICSLAILIQTATSQYIGNPLNPGLNFNQYGPGCANGPASPGYGSASSGGGFSVTSKSPIAPTGVSVLAENLAIEGPLSVGGQLPFVGSVGLEGALPAFGSGAVSYACGNGNVGITNEGLGAGISPFNQAGNNFGPNPFPGPNLFGPAGVGSNAPGFGPNTPGFGLNAPGFGPNGPGFGPNGPGFGPNGPGFRV